MANSNLTNAKRAKNDEFYTQYPDIEKEVEAYLEYNPDVFRGQTVYANCDDPYESNFFRYFVLNFNRLGLKKLITTSYKPSPIANMELPLIFHDKKSEKKIQAEGRPKMTANKFIIQEVGDIDGDGEFNLRDIAEQLKANKHNEWAPLKENGDFRSSECVELLEQSDIVVTNPPFSLFREYVKQLFDYNKKFLIIGNINAITYKEIFPLIKDNKMWLGVTMDGRNKWFQVPDYYPIRENVANSKIEDGKKFLFVKGCLWFTNLDHGRRHQPLSLMTMAENKRFNKQIQKNNGYIKYDNYNAIEVPCVRAIPRDYDGVMGVPISFLYKYNPEQFEIIGNGQTMASELGIKPIGQKFVDDYYAQGNKGSINAKWNNLVYHIGEKVYIPYQRILIKHKK